MGSDQNSGHSALRRELNSRRNFALTPFFAARANYFRRDCLNATVLHQFTCVVPSGSCLINFLKTHAIAATVNERQSPRAFQKISDSTAQWFPLDDFLAREKQPLLE
jgi:hypothetical protein